MEVLTEADLRSARLDESVRQYVVKPGTFVTPLAREFMRDRKIELVFRDDTITDKIVHTTKTVHTASDKVMPQVVIKNQGKKTFINEETGEYYSEKPERMTHLYGNHLVPKTHPRITFRGKLDRLGSEIVLLQTEVENPVLLADLEELLQFVRQLLGAEVTGKLIAPIELFGLNEQEIHQMSHHVKETFGMEHPIPDYRQGKLVAQLNLLRAKCRETELAGEFAFPPEAGRDDLLMALNRLSSAVYILECRMLSGYYWRGK